MGKRNHLHIEKNHDTGRVSVFQENASPIDENGRCRPCVIRRNGKGMVRVADVPMSADHRKIKPNP